MRWMIVMLMFVSCDSAQDTNDLARYTEWLRGVAHGSRADGPNGESVAGYRFHSFLSWSKKRTLGIVSREDVGLILLFDEHGRRVFASPARQINSVMLEDLNADGTQELITTEVEARGTGVYRETFNLYSVETSRVVRLWSGVSRAVLAPPDGEATTTVGYLRTDLRGASHQQPTLTHLVFVDDRPPRTTFIRVLENASGEALRVAVE